LKTKIDADLGKRVFIYPSEGRFLHAPNNMPTSFNEPIAEIPWWKDEKYVIGNLTKKKRSIRIINGLTHQEETLEVPSEESINEIRDRYLMFNNHAPSYTFKDIFGKVMDMNLTLEENGIHDLDEEWEYLDVADDEKHIPALIVYFDDDLTEG
jgi:hypothetical protein